MSTWKDRWKASPQAVTAAVAAAVKPRQAMATRSRVRPDPFYSESERWAAINAAADERGGQWIPRRRDWLQRTRT